MNEQKKRIPYPVIVEGKYDKIKITSIFDAAVFTTDGFSVFRHREKAAFFRKLAEKTKIILFTDSDGAGAVIRRFFRDAVPRDRLIELWAPQIKGREARKSAPSKEGFLGVEGLERETLEKIFEPVLSSRGEDGENGEADSSLLPSLPPLTKTDLFTLGLTGGENSSARRAELCRSLGLPVNLPTNTLLDALNLLGWRGW